MMLGHRYVFFKPLKFLDLLFDKYNFMKLPPGQHHHQVVSVTQHEPKRLEKAVQRIPHHHHHHHHGQAFFYFSQSLVSVVKRVKRQNFSEFSSLLSGKILALVLVYILKIIFVILQSWIERVCNCIEILSLYWSSAE